MNEVTESSEDEKIKYHSAEEIFEVKTHSGDTLFSVVSLILGIITLTQIDEQTKWFNNMNLFVQPRFWPGLCLVGFVLFSIGDLYFSIKKHYLKLGEIPLIPSEEIIAWLKPIEYAVYFIVYVFLVPKLGYLPTTLIVFPLLTYRVGYRTLKYFLLSQFMGIATVLIFKTLLQVRIPGGELYELLPEQMRNFMILYL